MASLVSAQRATRSTASLLRPLRTAQVAFRGQRFFHESGKAEAVEAVNTQTPTGFQQPPPAPFTANKQHAAGGVPPVNFGTAAYPSVPEGQLNVIAQAYKPEFYETVSQIMKLRQQYVEKRAIFVESNDMIPLLLGLGARREDLAGMAVVSDNLYKDPTLPFRRSRNGRFCIDFDTNTLRRLEFQPFTLTADEDFKRYDSGEIRRFDEILDNLQCNSVLQALFVFKAMVLHGVNIARRPKLEYDTNKWVTTLFNVRTVTTPEMLGEPALEGVHSDGVDHTMTTYLGAKNMADGSAATFFHDMGETTGIQLDEISPKHLLGRVHHNNFLDTLMIVDHERKHSLSPVHPIDATKEATRDMLVFFTRKPVEKDHVSGSMDSLTPHEGLPMEVPLYVPRM